MPQEQNADKRTEAQKALGIRSAEEKQEDAPAAREEAAESEEEEEDEDESSESPEEADEEDEESEDEPESEDEDDESDESDEDDEEEESEDTVPLKRLLAEKDKVKNLEKRIEQLESKFGEDAEKALVGEMAKELDIKPEAAAKLLEFSSKAILSKLQREGRIVTPELKKKLDAFQEGKTELSEAETQKKQEQREIGYFNDEWTDFVPTLKKQFKNATPQMLKEAAAQMYKLARSKAYGFVPGVHPAYPLDYIFFKEKKTFDTLLRVAKGRSGEPGHDVGHEGDPEKPDFLDPNMSPEKLQQYKAHQQAQKLARDKAEGSVRFR